MKILRVVSSIALQRRNPVLLKLRTFDLFITFTYICRCISQAHLFNLTALEGLAGAKTFPKPLSITLGKQLFFTSDCTGEPIQQAGGMSHSLFSSCETSE